MPNWRKCFASLSFFLSLIHLPSVFAANNAQIPQRIVSLAPHITEMLFAIGAGNQVVAVDQASDYPEEVKALPRVASYQSLNAESLLAARPDLVVIWQSTQALMRQQIEALGIPILVVNTQTLDELPKELKLLGERTGHQQQANALSETILSKFAKYRQASLHKTKVRAFYQLWYPPLTTVAKGSFINEVMAMCGAENPFANLTSPYPQLNEESVLVANPNIIFATHHGSDLKHWEKWSQIDAVKNHHLYMLKADWLHRLGPRILLGIDQMCKYTDQVRASEKMTESPIEQN